MDLNKPGNITLIEADLSSTSVDIYRSYEDMIVDLCKHSSTFNVLGGGSVEHVKGLTKLIDALTKIRDDMVDDLDSEISEIEIDV